MYSGNAAQHPADNSNLWITGLNTNGKDNGAGWAIGGGNAYCELPTALTGFTIDVTGADFSLNLWDKDYGVYTGGATGNPTVIRASVNNYANWTLNESNAYYLWDNDISVGANSGNIVLGTVSPLTSTTDGVWENNSTWGGTMPSMGDTKTVNNNITINSNVVSNGVITINSGKTLTIKTGSSLTLNSDLTTNDGLILEHGAQLIITGVSTGNTTYKRTLTAVSDGADANFEGWFAVSPPVSGEALNTAWANANSLASSTGSKRWIGTYTESSNTYAYFNGTATTFKAGKGYILKRTTNGEISFNGKLNTLDTGVNIDVTKVDKGYNLVGNPYTSIINSATFLTDNAANLAKQQIWVWNDNGNTYNAKTAGINFKVAPGQAFFVQANKEATLNFAESNQEIGADTFQKGSETKIKLMVSNNRTQRYAEIYYLDEATLGYDTGFEGEVFGGIEDSFSLYTHLLENNQGNNYQIQALPNANLETMVIPVGIKAEKGEEITLTADVFNLPTGIKVFLEDRQEGMFYQLNEVNSKYTITLNEAIDGVGRFYLYTRSSALATEDILLQGVSIFKSDKSTLKITGLKNEENTVYVYNVFGKQVLNSSFKVKKGTKEIQLPNFATGVYFIQLVTKEGKLTKKIIL